MKKVRLIIAGAGSRGAGYAEFAKAYPERLEIVGVAEPRDFYRNEMAKKFNIPEKNVYADWQDMAKRRKFADGVIIATQDNMHTEPALKFARKGYHIMLEKPLGNHNISHLNIGSYSPCNTCKYDPGNLKFNDHAGSRCSSSNFTPT